jgi:hypothetical protein
MKQILYRDENSLIAWIFDKEIQVPDLLAKIREFLETFQIKEEDMRVRTCPIGCFGRSGFEIIAEIVLNESDLQGYHDLGWNVLHYVDGTILSRFKPK